MLVNTYFKKNFFYNVFCLNKKNIFIYLFFKNMVYLMLRLLVIPSLRFLKVGFFFFNSNLIIIFKKFYLV